MVDFSANNVEKFAPGSTVPVATYTTGLALPQSLAIGPNGNLYVANYLTHTVVEFAAGSTSLVATYTNGLDSPRAMAFDSSGNLYVANEFGLTVAEFAAGTTSLVASYPIGNSDAVALAFDSSGNLYVAKILAATVEKFAAGSTTRGYVFELACRTPKPWPSTPAATYTWPTKAATRWRSSRPGSTTLVATYSSGVSQPVALLVDSGGNLYVGNQGNNTVEKFAAGSASLVRHVLRLA